MQHNKDIPVLSGVRGLAILIVFLSHASNIYFDGIITGWGGGQLGVMLFFMLSGFLMSHLYMGRPQEPDSLRAFAVNRMARIYPMFAVVVVACYAIELFNLPVYGYPIESFQEVLLHLSFIHGYSVLWTIGPEVIFYAIFIFLWNLHGRSTITFWWIVTALVAIAWLPLKVGEGSSLLLLHDKLPYFIAGTLIGIKSEFFLNAKSSGQQWTGTAFWVSMIVFVLSLPQVLKLSGRAPKQLIGDPFSDPWAFPFYLVIIGAVFTTALLARPWLLTNRFATYAGKVSFSFYLLHFAVLKNMQPLMPTHPLPAIALAGALTLLLSTVSYYGVEDPCRRLIRNFNSSRGTSVTQRVTDA